ncbi:hypothetical protein C9439_06885 [archaeon SCG-AAA382B04]|nr:hypothetical protein C9439_06885 [archaeon SCG-AAA382B04]
MDVSLIINPEVLERVYFLLTNILPIVVIGVYLGNFFSELGLIQKLSIASYPIIKLANLPNEAGASITSMLASPAASYSMLANFYEKGILTEKETIITTFTNTFFFYIRTIPTYYLPFVVPILGLKTGLIYITVRLFISFISTLVGVFIGYLYLEPRETDINNKRELERTKSFSKKLKDGFNSSIPTFKKILPRLIVIYFLVAVAISNNLFEPIGQLVSPVTGVIGIPGEASTIIIARFADVSSSFVLAGELLTKEIVSPIEAITALLIGSVLSLSTHFLKSSLPNKIAYFGSDLGTKIAFYNLILSVATVILTIFLLNFLAF